MIKRFIFILLILVFALPALTALDFWRFPESAEPGSIFAGGFVSSFAFSINNPRDFRFQLNFPEFYIDYVMPIGLPFSFGLSLKPMTPDIFALGIRPAYHINFNNPNLNVYVMYTVTFSLTQEFGLLEYGGSIGLRYRVFNFLFFNVETGFRMRFLRLGLAIQLN